LRITTFISQPLDEAQVRAWWDQANPQPIDDPIVQTGRGITNITGRRGAMALALRAERERVSWLCEPVLQGPDARPAGLASLGPMPDVIAPFQEYARRILGAASCPQSERLAFGAVLLRQTPSREDGYRELQGYLHSLRLDPANCRDLFYQVNRQRPSAVVSGCPVNRLSKWSLAHIHNIQVVIEIGGRPPTTHQDGDMILAVRVELDINTAREFQGQFLPEQQHKVLAELLDMGLEISEKGDIP
jgi:hypothetical protein